MRTKSIVFYIIAMPLLAAGCAGNEAKVAKISDAIIKESATYSEFSSDKITSLVSEFRPEYLDEKILKTYSDRTVIRFYEALMDATSEHPEDAIHVQMQKNVLEEKLRRKKAHDHDLSEMLMTYLSARNLDQAAAFRNRFPNTQLPMVPEIISSTATPQSTLWNVYDISDGGKKAQLRALPMGTGPQIVMIMLTGCSAGETAMSDILADAEFGPLFRKHGTVITNKFDSQGISMWQDYFKFPGVYIISKKSAFPNFKFDNSPQFYFLKDGKIISEQLGWGRDNRKPESMTKFRKGLQSIIGVPETSTISKPQT